MRRVHRTATTPWRSRRPAPCGRSAATAPGSSAWATRSSRACRRRSGRTPTGRRSPPATASATAAVSSTASRTPSTTTRSRSRTNGSLWAWGANDYGQLGVGGGADRLAPTRVDMATDWAAVACGDDYSAGLKTDGTLWAWGRDQFGQLGTVDLVRQGRTHQVTTGTGLDTFNAFACGAGRDGSHMLAVRTDGTLWGWGSNGTGELAAASAYPPLDPAAHSARRRRRLEERRLRQLLRRQLQPRRRRRRASSGRGAATTAVSWATETS